ADSIDDVVVDDPSQAARILIIGWGSTYGPIGAGVRAARSEGINVAHAHLRHLNPFPSKLGDVLAGYEKVIVAEMNLGQLRMLLRARYLVDAGGYNKVRGMPFGSDEIAECITQAAKNIADHDLGDNDLGENDLGEEKLEELR